VRAEVEQVRREEPGDDEHERARHARCEEAQPQDQPERRKTDEQRRPAHIAEPAEPRCELAPGGVAGARRAGQLRQLADHDVHRRSGEEPRDDGA
jgi:hypothetical protein